MFDVEKIKRKTLLKYPFFGSLVAGCRIIQTEKMPTACTDGKNIFVNPNFMEMLDEAGQEFVLAHEILHIASDHIRRSDGKVKKTLEHRHRRCYQSNVEKRWGNNSCGWC